MMCFPWFSNVFSRSPYGERGLKFPDGRRNQFAAWSLSLRRAWIEIGQQLPTVPFLARRSPYGERGLKCVVQGYGMLSAGRSPYGERGLKLHVLEHAQIGLESLSLRRAWIEMNDCSKQERRARTVALLTESVD